MSTIKTIIESIKPILVELVKLQRPATAAAVVAFLLAVIPGVNISAAALTAVVLGVGGVAAFIEKLVEFKVTGKVSVRTPFKR